MNELQQVVDHVARWADETFPGETVESNLKHLAREVKELLAEPGNILEYADAATLLFNAARLAGYNVDDVVAGMRVKLDINKQRQWAPPDEEGVISHVREA